MCACFVEELVKLTEKPSDCFAGAVCQIACAAALRPPGLPASNRPLLIPGMLAPAVRRAAGWRLCSLANNRCQRRKQRLPNSLPPAGRRASGPFSCMPILARLGPPSIPPSDRADYPVEAPAPGCIASRDHMLGAVGMVEPCLRTDPTPGTNRGDHPPPLAQ